MQLALFLWKASSLQLRCLPLETDLQMRMCSKTLWQRKRESLQKHSCQNILCPANLLQEWLHDMLQVKKKTKTKHKQKLLTDGQQVVQTTFNTEKAIWWLNLIQCPLRVLTATDTTSENPCQTARGYPEGPQEFRKRDSKASWSPEC